MEVAILPDVVAFAGFRREALRCKRKAVFNSVEVLFHSEQGYYGALSGITVTPVEGAQWSCIGPSHKPAIIGPQPETRRKRQGLESFENSTPESCRIMSGERSASGLFSWRDCKAVHGEDSWG